MVALMKSLIIAVLILGTLAWIPNAQAEPPDSYWLQVIKLPDQRILLEIEVKAQDRFYIDYIHSKDKTPVHDVFLIGEEARLVLLEEHYEWYGAGLAFHPAGKGRIIFEKDRTRVILNRELTEFRMRVGRVANHALTYKGQRIPLLSIANGGDLIEITVARTTEVKNHE